MYQILILVNLIPVRLSLNLESLPGFYLDLRIGLERFEEEGNTPGTWTIPG